MWSLESEGDHEGCTIFTTTLKHRVSSQGVNTRTNTVCLLKVLMLTPMVQQQWQVTLVASRHQEEQLHHTALAVTVLVTSTHLQ